jgi:hypothetical protein
MMTHLMFGLWLLGATMQQKSVSSAAAETISIAELWRQTREKTMRPNSEPDFRERAALRLAAEQLFAALRRGEMPLAFEHAAAMQGFGLKAYRVRLPDGEEVLGLVDPNGGRGGYLLRAGPVDAEVIIQAPHRFFDRYTGPIARRAFVAGKLRGFFFNTAHRYSATGGEPEPHSDTDVARQKNSTLAALTLAASQVFGVRVVLQLHGFGEKDSVGNIDAIVSPGALPDAAAPRANRIAVANKVAALWRGFGRATRRYPDDIGVLGGTENAVGVLLCSTPTAFVHVELSAAERGRLLEPGQAEILGSSLAQLFSVAAQTESPR